MTGAAHIRLLCVDDHPLFREGIAAVLAYQEDMQLVATAASAGEAILAFRRHRPDVSLMDLRLPDADGVDAITRIRDEFPEARIVMLTTFEGDAETQRALSAGAHGYLLKSAPREELLDAIRKVHAGRRYLSPQVAENLAEHFHGTRLSGRESEVLARIAEGDRNRDIGKALCISEETVKVHIRHIMNKLCAKDRTQAVAIAIRRGIIHI